MRRFSSITAGVVMATVALLALSACSGGTDAAQDGGAFATVETEFGEVVIDERPERVVALGWADAEMALQLGVEPVGAADWVDFGEDSDGLGPWVENTYEESPETLGTMELSYEAVAGLEPDLILDVNSSGEEERYERLSSIADTVGVGPGGANYLTDRDEQLRMIGEALGESERAAEIIEEQQTAFAEVATQHPEWQDLTISVVSRTSEGWGAHVQGDSRAEFVTDLGFTNNPELEELSEEGEWSVNISDEQLDLFDADLIIGFPIWIDEEEITEDDGWNNIPSVEDGRAIVIGDEVSDAFSTGSPEAKLYALEELVPMIEEALSDH